MPSIDGSSQIIGPSKTDICTFAYPRTNAAHIMIAKFDDHIPLYRLSEMYDRLGIDISRSVMADWVGRVSILLAPLVLAIRAHVAAVDRIHTDDTPVDVLDPGRGKTKTGRVWVYVFDGSGYQDPTPGAIAYYYSPDRKGAHPGPCCTDQMVISI
ncbi:hypothetical protein JOH51_005801 [Rhizobium leguminosarum]|nr:hypothetical protein [Rhizobium leguminosarum]